MFNFDTTKLNGQNTLNPNSSNLQPGIATGNHQGPISTFIHINDISVAILGYVTDPNVALSEETDIQKKHANNLFRLIMEKNDVDLLIVNIDLFKKFNFFESPNIQSDFKNLKEVMSLCHNKLDAKVWHVSSQLFDIIEDFQGEERHEPIFDQLLKYHKALHNLRADSDIYSKANALKACIPFFQNTSFPVVNPELTKT